METPNVKTIICAVGLCLLAANIAIGQDAKPRSRAFQGYQVDTLHLQGDAAKIKKNVISIQQQEAVRSAFWDEEDRVLTVEYDSSLLSLSIIRAYFDANLSRRTIIIVARMKKADGTN